MAVPDGPRPPPRRRSFCAPPAGCLHRDTILPAPLPPPDKSRCPRARKPPRQLPAGAAPPLPKPLPSRKPSARQKPPPEGPQTRRQLPAGPLPDRKPLPDKSRRPRARKPPASSLSGPLPGRKPSASQKPPPRARKPTASSLPGRTALAGLLPGRKPPPGEGRRPTALKPITRAALPLFTSSPSCSPARWPPCRSGVRSPSRSPPLPQIPFRSLQPVPPGVPAGTVRRGAPAPFASPPGR